MKRFLIKLEHVFVGWYVLQISFIFDFENVEELFVKISEVRVVFQ